MRIGIESTATIVINGMQDVNSQGQAASLSLRAAYQAAWCRYLTAVRRWQSLQNESPLDGTSLQEAERAAVAAEEQYRCARNMLADMMLERGRSAFRAEFHAYPNRPGGGLQQRLIAPCS
jgi:hypothetical protein